MLIFPNFINFKGVIYFLYSIFFFFLAEIILFDGFICVYRSNVDLFFYVIGSCNENELILQSVLNCFYEDFYKNASNLDESKRFFLIFPFILQAQGVAGSMPLRAQTFISLLICILSPFQGLQESINLSKFFKVYNNKNRGSRPKTKLKDEFRRDEEFVMWRLKNWSIFSLLCLNGFLGHMNGGTSYSSLYLFNFLNKTNLVFGYPQY